MNIIRLPDNVRINGRKLHGVLPDGRIPIAPRYQRRLYRPGRGRWGGVYRMLYTPTVAGIPARYADAFARGWKD